jgi:hypothetical protein
MFQMLLDYVDNFTAGWVQHSAPLHFYTTANNQTLGETYINNQLWT